MENTNERLSEIAFDLEAIKTILDNAIFESEKRRCGPDAN